MFYVLGIEVKGSEDKQSSELIKTVIYNGETTFEFNTKGEVYEFYHRRFQESKEKVITYCYKLKRVESFFAFGDIFPHGDNVYLSDADSRKVEEGTVEETLLSIDTDYATFRDGFALTKLDLEYSGVIQEVKTLYEHITKLMKLYKDDLKSIPRTSTGYPRRDLRRACRRNKEYRKWFLSTKLSAQQYYMCLNAFKGALCFSNPFHRGDIVEGYIVHRDFRSHYPSQLRTRLFPIGKPETYYDIDSVKYHFTHEQVDIDDIIADTDYTYIIELVVRNLKLKAGITAPILLDKDFDILPTNAIIDNHHVIVNKDINKLYLDSVTLKWLRKQYNFEYVVLRAFRMKNGPLPKEYAEVIDKYFIEKADKTKDAFEHAVDKQRLNAIYGCFVQKPIRRTIKSFDKTAIQKALDEYYGNFSSFLPYQIGIMVTSYARDELLEYIELIGYDKVLYGDTDSLFYLSDIDTDNRVLVHNSFKEMKAPKVKLKDGSMLSYDSFELEHKIKRFKSLKSKVYGYETEDGEFKVVIGGIPEVGQDGVTREQEVGSLENLTKDTVFHSCARIVVKWLDYGYIRYKQDESTLEVDVMSKANKV